MMRVADAISCLYRRISLAKGGLSFEGGLDAAGLRIAVVVARFNAHVTGPLYDGCREELAGRGLDLETLTGVEVPGCFELPVVAKELAASGRYDAVICIGAVIRGDTPHFDYVSSGTASGIQRAALDTGVPVIFGVLTTDNEEQALERVGGAAGHKGREAALTAIEMAITMRRLRGG
jgi:6,7-dimethyl-8-ribityllumazine synthase